MIGARQPNGPNYRSLLSAAYPTREDINMMRAEPAGVTAFSGLCLFDSIRSNFYICYIFLRDFFMLTSKNQIFQISFVLLVWPLKYF